MEIRSAIILILCVVVGIDCATVVQELPSDQLVALDSKSEDSAKRAVRQVAVNVGPVGVGVGPFGGVGVRVGPWINIGVAPSYQRAAPLIYPAPVPVAYQAAVPVTYQAAVPVAYQTAVPVAYQASVPHQRKYSYSSDYRYNYSY